MVSIYSSKWFLFIVKNGYMKKLPFLSDKIISSVTTKQRSGGIEINIGIHKTCNTCMILQLQNC